MNSWTRAGIEAYRAGHLQQARRYLRLAVMEHPDDVQAWLWSVQLAETDVEKQRYLERILLLDPNQKAARHPLNSMKVRARYHELPHVSPFTTDPSDEEAGSPSAAQPVSSEPFVSGAQPPAPATLPTPGNRLIFWLKQPWWVWVGLGTAALTAFGLLVWLVSQFMK